MRSPKAQNLRYSITETELGLMLIASSGKGLQFLAIGEDAERLKAELADFSVCSVLDSELEETARQIVANVKLGISHHIALDPVGTAFQKRVWSELCKIPAGQVITYSELARRIGNPSAIRAAARACAANNLAIVIPCHRVIGVDGKLTGFRWGIDVKHKLLSWEGAQVGDNGRLAKESELLFS